MTHTELPLPAFYDPKSAERWGYHPDQQAVFAAATAFQKVHAIKPSGSDKENDRRPHRCVVKWGSTVPSFRCVIESVSTKYTMFTDDGTPVRATCTVKLKEADVVSMAQGGGGES